MNEIRAALPHPLQLIFQRGADVPSLPARSSPPFVPFLGSRDSFSSKRSSLAVSAKWLGRSCRVLLVHEGGREGLAGRVPGAAGCGRGSPRDGSGSAAGLRRPRVAAPCAAARAAGTTPGKALEKEELKPGEL